jgi:hypothetical protein
MAAYEGTVMKIEEFKDIINWGCISGSQKMSLNFIKKFRKRINFANLLNNPNIDKGVMKSLCRAYEKYKERLSEIDPFDFI